MVGGPHGLCRPWEHSPSFEKKIARATLVLITPRGRGARAEGKKNIQSLLKENHQSLGPDPPGWHKRRCGNQHPAGQSQATCMRFCLETKGNAQTAGSAAVWEPQFAGGAWVGQGARELWVGGCVAAHGCQGHMQTPSRFPHLLPMNTDDDDTGNGLGIPAPAVSKCA